METVTYLLGAGASAGPANSKHGYTDISTVPIVSQLAGRMLNQIDELESLLRSQENSVFEKTSITIKILLDSYTSKLAELVKTLERHASIDTYARKLFLQTKYGEEVPELKNLKRIFSTFLTIEQVLRGVDIRYDSLFATILKKQGEELESPNNFKFISWNYDYQFELAHYNYFVADERNFDKYILDNQLNSIKDPSKFFFIKLNGSALNINRRINQHSANLLLYNNQNIWNDQEVILSMLLLDLEGSTNIFTTQSKLSFSWENQIDTIEAIKSLKMGLTDCKSLVVIGYSFPIFNNLTDVEVLAVLPNLKKVYLQVPDSSFKDIEHRFWRAASRVFAKERLEVINISNLDSFYIPNEIDM